MYSIQYVHGCPNIDYKLHRIKMNVHYSIQNYPSKVHKWRERKDMKEMSIYSIDTNIDNGHWL